LVDLFLSCYELIKFCVNVKRLYYGSDKLFESDYIWFRIGYICLAYMLVVFMPSRG